MPYQDRWIRGATLAHGDRECEARYALVRRVVSKFHRPITVLDLGANLGYFGCRLADEFGAVSVMVDTRPDLVAVCEANALPTTIALTKKLSVVDLQEMAASEHFDVVLALNVLHHFKDPAGALSAVLDLGDHVLLETPSRDDAGAAHPARCAVLLDLLEAAEPTLLGETPSHVTPGVVRPLYHLRRQKRRLTASYAYGARVGQPKIRTHRIEATFGRKEMCFKGQAPREWHPGMNLWNWCQLGGSYPSRATIAARVTQAVAESAHGDVRPWNFILQGTQVVAIDHDHRDTHGDARALEETLAWIHEPARAYRPEPAPCSA